MATKKCNTYRLQDVHTYIDNPWDFREYFRTRQGKQMKAGSKAFQSKLMSISRLALRDACVSVPRTAKTPEALRELATREGLKRGFNARLGIFETAEEAKEREYQWNNWRPGRESGSRKNKARRR